MNKGYIVQNGLNHDGQKVFVVSNYDFTNKVVTRGFIKMPEIDKYDIGFWKIKKLKNEI